MFSSLDHSAVLNVLVGICVKVLPLFLSVALGLIIGWVWKPRWVTVPMQSKRHSDPSLSTLRSGEGFISSILGLACQRWRQPNHEDKGQSVTSDFGTEDKWADNLAVNANDLRTLIGMLEEENRGGAWQLLIDKSVQSMSYQAWRRDFQDRHSEYRSRTVFDNVTPELMRDFFWDDEFRLEWDGMLRSARTLEECPRTGFMVVQWIRKFPFFCKDREYIIARRIWQHGNTFYCITKGNDHPSMPRKKTPRRVDAFYSSFRIRAVESLKGDGRMTASEVMLFHYEDMGIQKDIAKWGVRQGMWGCVEKLKPAVAKYVATRKLQQHVSRAASMAHLTTQVPNHVLVDIRCNQNEKESKPCVEKKQGGNPLKWVFLVAAVALACGAEKGAVGKFFVVGIARRLGRFGNRRL